MRFNGRGFGGISWSPGGWAFCGRACPVMMEVLGLSMYALRRQVGRGSTLLRLVIQVWGSESGFILGVGRGS